MLFWSEKCDDLKLVAPITNGPLLSSKLFSDFSWWGRCGEWHTRLMYRFERTFLIYNDHDHDPIIHDHDNVHASISPFTIDGVPLQEGLTPLVQVSFI